MGLDIIHFPRRKCFNRTCVWPQIKEVRANVFDVTSKDDVIRICFHFVNSNFEWNDKEIKNKGNDILTDNLINGTSNCIGVCVSLVCGRRITHISSHFCRQRKSRQTVEETGFANKKKKRDRFTNTGEHPQKPWHSLIFLLNVADIIDQITYRCLLFFGAIGSPIYISRQ